MNAPDKPFDLEGATRAMSTATLSILKLYTRPPGVAPTPDEAQEVFTGMREAAIAGIAACAEVKRLREEVAGLRDSHRPKPHADPSKPGALCAACSTGGSLVAWPCDPWTTAERILTHGKA
ncbi:hypothetical protein ACIQRE_01860 [Streptomyces griseoluteus]|uniref:hypothetical protein n=1 Tax=Streptomyces griseoluteus TaxID=29306 RepID=UPI0037FFF88B